MVKAPGWSWRSTASWMSCSGKPSSFLNVVEEIPEFKILGAPGVTQQKARAFLGSSVFAKPPSEADY